MKLDDEIAAIRRILELIDAGELDATPARVWHLRGVLDALESLERRRAGG